MVTIDAQLTTTADGINQIVKSIIDGDIDNGIGYFNLKPDGDNSFNLALIADIDSQTFWDLVGTRDSESVLANTRTYGEIDVAGSEFGEVYHIHFKPSTDTTSKLSGITWNDHAVDIETFGLFM